MPRTLGVPLETPARIVQTLTGRGYNTKRETVTLIVGSGDPGRTPAYAVGATPDDVLRITTDHIREALASTPTADPSGTKSTLPAAAGTADVTDADPAASTASDPFVSAVTSHGNAAHTDQSAPAEAQGISGGRNVDPALRSFETANNMTDQSTGTDEYDDFVKVFCDRYEKLSKLLRGRVNRYPTKAISNMSGGGGAELIGLVDDVRSTKDGHWIIDLKDTTGTFPCLVMKDKSTAGCTNELLMDERITVQETLSGDVGILLIDSMHFPDVSQSHRSNTADRSVQAALIPGVHVGSQESMADAWNRFTDWLHTEGATRIEYLLIAGNMVEGVGAYPNQDEGLDVIDICEQCEAFSEHPKSVPGDLEIVMIPDSYDAVRLAEPQPGFDGKLHDIMSTHDTRVTSSPSMVMFEGANVLIYRDVPLDEVTAELPTDEASYDESYKAMYQLLKERHVAPQFGGHTRLVSEELDYFVMEDVPDILHTDRVHKLGRGKYHNALTVNSGCWWVRTDFQKSVNIDLDTDHALTVDFDMLSMTVQKLS